ncbi:hypothetical protein GCM10028796_34880 [Ramlibacter monticola]|uniref:Uncharacterized protein n=1 Tax=Ramlibacter monticola TaxID=1926872 RepID=A0A936ZCJ5_9BURK|nr:hypothetical protein [Ramlibacter monticola]MBL0395291.1 hypothetical protein [Ramlibacter monticola]
MNELLAHAEELQHTYATATPAARLRAIRQRLASAHAEMGPARLVTMVGAVEALARSLIVHAAGRPASTAVMRHRQFRDTGAVELVEEVLRLRAAPGPSEMFGADVWQRFEAALRYRDLIVHECTYIGRDAHSELISAATTVLRALIELAGLDSGLQAVA